MEIKSPEYWWADGTHTVFNKYYLDKNNHQKCASYINDAHEKDHDSQSDAVKYLRSSGWEKADSKQIRRVFDKEGRFAYGRTWKLIV